MALFIGAGAFATPVVIAPQSHAAAGDPFDPAEPQVFIGQDVPTRPYKAITGASGSVTWAGDRQAGCGRDVHADGEEQRAR